jgi:GNAT superfamily N-acetyltransferase
LRAEHRSGTIADVLVKRAMYGDEPTLRSVRLRALTDAPDAFGSTLEREIARTDSDWSRWIEPNPTFLLEAPSLGAVGMVAGAMDEFDPSAALLLAMWVDPASRGTGAADLLVQAVVDWARTNNATTLSLCVIEGNVSAIRLYERTGFILTGQCRSRERDERTELTMQLVL